MIRCQFLFSPLASRYWSECSCNWHPVLSTCVEKAPLSAVGDGLPEEERNGKVCCGSVLAEAPTMGPPSHSGPVTWFHLHPWECWIWCILPSLVAGGTICQMDLGFFSILQCVRREDLTSGCLHSFEFLQFPGQRSWWWVPLCNWGFGWFILISVFWLAQIVFNHSSCFWGETQKRQLVLFNCVCNRTDGLPGRPRKFWNLLLNAF